MAMVKNLDGTFTFVPAEKADDSVYKNTLANNRVHSPEKAKVKFIEYNGERIKVNAEQFKYLMTLKGRGKTGKGRGKTGKEDYKELLLMGIEDPDSFQEELDLRMEEEGLKNNLAPEYEKQDLSNQYLDDGTKDNYVSRDEEEAARRRGHGLTAEEQIDLNRRARNQPIDTIDMMNAHRFNKVKADTAEALNTLKDKRAAIKDLEKQRSEQGKAHRQARHELSQRDNEIYINDKEKKLQQALDNLAGSPLVNMLTKRGTSLHSMGDIKAQNENLIKNKILSFINNELKDYTSKNKNNVNISELVDKLGIAQDVKNAGINEEQTKELFDQNVGVSLPKDSYPGDMSKLLKELKLDEYTNDLNLDNVNLKRLLNSDTFKDKLKGFRKNMFKDMQMDAGYNPVYQVKSGENKVLQNIAKAYVTGDDSKLSDVEYDLLQDLLDLKGIPEKQLTQKEKLALEVFDSIIDRAQTDKDIGEAKEARNEAKDSWSTLNKLLKELEPEQKFNTGDFRHSNVIPLPQGWYLVTASGEEGGHQVFMGKKADDGNFEMWTVTHRLSEGDIDKVKKDRTIPFADKMLQIFSPNVDRDPLRINIDPSRDFMKQLKQYAGQQAEAIKGEYNDKFNNKRQQMAETGKNFILDTYVGKTPIEIAELEGLKDTDHIIKRIDALGGVIDITTGKIYKNKEDMLKDNPDGRARETENIVDNPEEYQRKRELGIKSRSEQIKNNPNSVHSVDENGNEKWTLQSIADEKRAITGHNVNAMENLRTGNITYNKRYDSDINPDKFTDKGKAKTTAKKVMPSDDKAEGRKQVMRDVNRFNKSAVNDMFNKR